MTKSIAEQLEDIYRASIEGEPLEGLDDATQEDGPSFDKGAKSLSDIEAEDRSDLALAGCAIEYVISRQHSDLSGRWANVTASDYYPGKPAFDTFLTAVVRHYLYLNSSKTLASVAPLRKTHSKRFDRLQLEIAIQTRDK